MAGLGQRFDATQHDTEQRDYENIPDGDYILEVSKSEIAATTKGDGKILKLVYDVIEPEQFKGRKIFGNINLENANSTAQEIGLKEFASLCRAVGLSGVEDSDELHFISFTAKVGLSKARTVGTKTYEPRNEIKRFYFPDAGDVPEAKVAPAAAPANDNRATANDNKPAAAAAKTVAPAQARPWGKKAA